MFFEPHLRDRNILRHDPFKALIAPRPVQFQIGRRDPMAAAVSGQEDDALRADAAFG